MMTTYTRRGPGQSFLKDVLAERINSLIEHKELNLEVNPLKVYEQMITQIEEDSGSLPANLPKGVPPEVAQENADVQAIIAPRLTMLMEIANSFLNTIINAIDEVPYGIRWICKQIRSLTKRKYPDATDFAICSLIGGFFFLRFINPAIVTPQAYMLVDGLPAKHPRRTLTLIAKMLQNLANKPSYSKEQYMMSLNPFVENNKTRINAFLNALCDVGDFYDTLEVSGREREGNVCATSEILSDLIATPSLLFLFPSDGSIHGPFEERSRNLNHTQRTLQHSLSSSTTSRCPLPKRQATSQNSHRRTRTFSRTGPKKRESYSRITFILSMGDSNPRSNNSLHVREQCHSERHLIHGDQIDLRSANPFNSSTPKQKTSQFTSDRRESCYY